MSNAQRPPQQTTLTQYQLRSINSECYFESLSSSRNKRRLLNKRAIRYARVMDKAVTPSCDRKKSSVMAEKQSITLGDQSDATDDDFEPKRKRMEKETKKKPVSATISSISPSPKARKTIDIDSDASDVSVALLKERVKPDRPSSNQMGINSHNRVNRVKKRPISASLSRISPSPKSPKSSKTIDIDSDASEVSGSLLREQVQPGRPSSNQMGINSQHPETYVIEMTRDTMIRSFNVLHEKNIQLEHTVRNAKKEVRYLRRQLDRIHESSIQPSMSDIARFQLVEDGHYDSDTE